MSDRHPNRSFGAYLDQFPLLEFDAVLLGSGSFDLRSIEIWGKHSVLIRDRLTPHAASTMVAKPDWVLLNLPYPWTGDRRIDGKVAKPGDVLFLDAGREWYTSGAARETLAVGIRRSVLDAACADLRGVCAASLSDSILRPRSPAMAALMGRLSCNALDIAHGLGRIRERLVMPPDFEADMIAELAACLGRHTDDSVGVNRGRHSTARIVAATRNLLREQDPVGLNLTDLCRTLGVSRTRLHQCFVDTFGISAGRYIRKHRLSQAREWHCDSNAPPPSVPRAIRPRPSRHQGTGRLRALPRNGTARPH